MKKPIKKTAAKPVKAKAKSAPKKVKTVAKKPVAKAHAPKAAAKAKSPLKKPAAKSSAKAVAKPVAKKPVKAAAAKPVKKPAAKPVAKAVVKKAAPAPVVKAKVAAKEAPAKVVKAAPAAAVVKEVKEVLAPVVKAEKAAKPEKLTKAEKAAKAAAAAAPAEIFPALDPSVKRPAKPFFLEVKPGVERVIKRGDKSAASPVLDIQARRKGPAAEESSEELAERIERELQSQSFLKRNRMRPQLCTKCGINAVSPRFTIDRELGYCDSCAEILHLGETKEARRMEFNLSLKKEDPEAAADEVEEPSPDEVEDVPDDVD